MPNWNENKLFISGDESQLEDLLSHFDLDAPDLEIHFLKTLLPMPEILSDTISGSGEGTHPANLVALHETGYLNWWDWQHKNWGVKWGDCDTILLDDPSDGDLQFAFDTPWGPPTKGIVNISKQFDKLTFLLGYIETGMGFVGATLISNGEILKDIIGVFPAHPEDDDEGDYHVKYNLYVEAQQEELERCIAAASPDPPPTEVMSL